MNHNPYSKYHTDNNRVDRNKLVFDSTTIAETQEQSDHTIIKSRLGDHEPKPGYCLRFDSSNPDAYIQTKIPSSQRENYNVIIKSNGFYSMYVDSSSEYIAIRQIAAPVDSEYCEISYIAFKNRTTGKLDYLFECEEGMGVLLYDAITGQTATLCSSAGEGIIASLSSLRVTSKRKQWIKEDDNLDTCCITKSVALPFAKKDIVTKLPFSVCFDFEILDADKINFYYDNGGTTAISMYLWNGANSSTGGFNVMVVPSLARFTIPFYNQVITNEDGSTTTNGYVYYYIYYSAFPKYKGQTGAVVRRNFLNDGRHKLVLIFDGDITENGVYGIRKAFLDGESAVVKMSTDQQDIQYQTTTTPHHTKEFSTGAGTLNFNLTNYTKFKTNIEGDEGFLPWVKRYNTKVFNFDISAEDAPYSVDDWFSDRDVPQELLLVDSKTNTDNSIKQCCLSLRHNTDEQMDRLVPTSQITYLTDETINKNNVGNSSQRFYDDYRGNTTFMPNAYYGTWLNNVGSSDSLGWIMNSNMGADFEWVDINGNPQVGWTGAINADGLQIGGRGIPYVDGTNEDEGTGLPQVHGFVSVVDKETGVVEPIYLSNNTVNTNRPIMCCENRDLSQDADCPEEIKFAINYSQYQHPSTNWVNLLYPWTGFSNFHKDIESLGIDVSNTYLYYKYRYSVWLKKLPHPQEGISEYNRGGVLIGIRTGVEKIIKFSEIPTTWTKFEGTFTVYPLNHTYTWQHYPAVCAFIHGGSNKALRISNDPLAAIANPRIELVSLHHCKETPDGWVVGDRIPLQTKKYYPRKVIS